MDLERVGPLDEVGQVKVDDVVADDDVWVRLDHEVPPSLQQPGFSWLAGQLQPSYSHCAASAQTCAWMPSASLAHVLLCKPTETLHAWLRPLSCHHPVCADSWRQSRAVLL